jgi:hypothetical protein
VDQPSVSKKLRFINSSKRFLQFVAAKYFANEFERKAEIAGLSTSGKQQTSRGGGDASDVRSLREPLGLLLLLDGAGGVIPHISVSVLGELEQHVLHVLSLLVRICSPPPVRISQASLIKKAEAGC